MTLPRDLKDIERTAKQACDAMCRMLEGEVAHG